MSPTAPRTPSYRDDRYAVSVFGVLLLVVALVAAVVSWTDVGAFVSLAGQFAAPFAIGGVGVLFVAAGSESPPVNRRLISDTPGRRRLLRAGGLGLFTPLVTTVVTVVSDGASAELPSLELLVALATLPIVLALCWRGLDVVDERFLDGRTGEASPKVIGPTTGILAAGRRGDWKWQTV